MNTPTKEALHYGIAERGKLYCLDGNYSEALRHFREAIKMTVSQQSSEIFFQHYTQCVMETLERSGAYDEVISYCEKASDFLTEKEDQSDLIKRSLGTILEKQAFQHLHKEEREEALQLFKAAQETVGRGAQPLTDQLLNWLQRGYRLSPKQIVDAQTKHGYFIVRKDKVNPGLAVDLPNVASPC